MLSIHKGQHFIWRFNPVSTIGAAGSDESCEDPVSDSPEDRIDFLEHQL